MPNATDKRQAASPEEMERERASVTPEVERRVGIGVDDLASLILLEGVKGFGPEKFRELHTAGRRPAEVLREPDALPTKGIRGERFRELIRALDGPAKQVAQSRAVRQLARAHEHEARIVTYGDPHYPPNVFASNNPVPVLYVRGSATLLAEPRAVACVGSRDTKPPYSDRHHEFATHAATQGWSIVSGFALGADSIGHRAAYLAGGKTTVVMPCGLDRPFPPENRAFWRELSDYPEAVLVSEFAFGTAASSLTLRKRNKLIVAFARGVLVSQSAAKGGAMNAYRFALEQRKPVATFAPLGDEGTSGNVLIAEGAWPGRAPSAPELTPAGTVFPADKPDPPAWDGWLQQLSSSI